MRRDCISLVVSSSDHRHSGDAGDATNATYASGADDQPVPRRLQDTGPVPQELATHIDRGEHYKELAGDYSVTHKTCCKQFVTSVVSCGQS